jgi:hypothetical protein
MRPSLGVSALHRVRGSDFRVVDTSKLRPWSP